MGLLSVLMYSYHEPRSFWSCMEVSVLPVGVVWSSGYGHRGGRNYLPDDGCSHRAAARHAWRGAWFQVQSHHWSPRNKPAVLCDIVLSFLGFFRRARVSSQAPTYVVRSAVESARRQRSVWKTGGGVLGNSSAHGIIVSRGRRVSRSRGNFRHGCRRHAAVHFSTGPFVEPITVWDEPHLLKFDVEENPAPLNELSPYKTHNPPHLHGYFISHGGQFLLTALPGGKDSR